MSERTPQEREAARLERERRRAAREGRPFPEPAAPEPSATPDVAATPAPEPPAAQDFAAFEPAAAAPDDRQDEAPIGPQTAGHHPEPQATQQYDVAADWTEEHAVVVIAPPEPEPHEEVPLGIKRVGAHERTRARATVADRPPAAPRPRGRMRRRAFALVPLALIAAIGWFLIALYQPFAGDPGSRVVVQVPEGKGVSEIGDLLAAKGVVSSAFFFRVRASLSGDTGKLKSGRFALREDMSYAAALDALTTNPPPPPTIRITLPEGPSRGELAARVKQAGVRGSYVAASRSSKALTPRRYGAPKGATLEGFLFPATYELKRGATTKQLVAEQLAAFKQNIAGVDLGYARHKNLTTFDVLTIASMVEREVAVPKERPLVAAVIYNRLHQGIPLGIDATLRFALNDWTHPLRVSQLNSTTPYNTRNHQGLPPGPIGNPGLASIKAAAHPANVGYLFYVVKPGTCGQHAFSSTDAQFQQDVAKYNAARDAAGGKSPTKC
jgi:uncharacterized YceG family protein